MDDSKARVNPEGQVPADPGVTGGGDELPPGITREQWEKHERRQAAIARANGEPLPGPLAEAFAREPVTVAGLRVRPLVHYDYVLLRRLDSPLYRRLLKAAQTGQEEYSDEEGYEMVFQFTRPIRSSMAVLDQGREQFRRAALEEIGLKLRAADVTKLVEECVLEFIRSASTTVEYQSPRSEDGSFFLGPKRDPTTDSDGGSATFVD